MRKIALILLAELVATPGVAQQLDARSAEALVHGCATHAIARKQSHAIVVVDTGGHIAAALRMDGNGSGVFDFAQVKAQAAAAWGFSTAQMAEAAKGTPGFANAPHVVIVPGGVPVFSADGKVRIGAIGVSGEAPADDAGCAEAGIKAAGLRSGRG
jgi:uncharacterized protein GlcG (DUF336 family)